MSSSTKGTVLLVRPKRHANMARLVRLETEPLELEYLWTVAESVGWQSEIYDGVVAHERFRSVLKRLTPDVVAFSGYYPARNAIIRLARHVKNLLPEATVVVGGVHAEINHEQFHLPQIDLVIRSDALNRFRNLLESGLEATMQMPGVCHGNEREGWTCNAIDGTLTLPDIKPNRAHFEANKRTFRYLEHGPTAIVKGAYGCPHDCSFCFCRLLNNGRYRARPIDDLLDEIEDIDADTVWIVDDIFLLDPARVLEFCEKVEHRELNKRFIVYGRADFIVDHAEILPVMKRAGIVDIVVGLEAVDEAALQDYRKQVSAQTNATCVQLLQKSGIGCTGLFIISHNSTRADFRSLDRWIAQTGLRVYTLSIFSPFPGTEIYAQYKDQLTTNDCRKWDLLHLVLPPGHMSRLEFYIRFYWLQAKVLIRKRHTRAITHGDCDAEVKRCVRS